MVEGPQTRWFMTCIAQATLPQKSECHTRIHRPQSARAPTTRGPSSASRSTVTYRKDTSSDRAANSVYAVDVVLSPTYPFTPGDFFYYPSPQPIIVKSASRLFLSPHNFCVTIELVSRDPYWLPSSRNVYEQFICSFVPRPCCLYGIYLNHSRYPLGTFIPAEIVSAPPHALLTSQKAV